MSVTQNARSRGIIGIFFRFSHTCQVSRFERDAHEFERLSRPHDRILKNTHNSRISRIIRIFDFYRFNNFLNHVINNKEEEFEDTNFVKILHLT